MVAHSNLQCEATEIAILLLYCLFPKALLFCKLINLWGPFSWTETSYCQFSLSLSLSLSLSRSLSLSLSVLLSLCNSFSLSNKTTSFVSGALTVFLSLCICLSVSRGTQYASGCCHSWSVLGVKHDGRCVSWCVYLPVNAVLAVLSIFIYVCARISVCVFVSVQ